MMNAERQGGMALLLHQWAQRAGKTGRACCGRFISGPELDLARHEAREADVLVSFDGGWPDADRMQVCFHPAEERAVFSRAWVHITWDSRFQKLRHSDLMGSLMALGIDRSWFGDLAAGEGEAWLACMPEMAARLPAEWQEAGHARIRCEQMENAPDIRLPSGRCRMETVASLRLDAVLSAGMNLSRSRAAEMIRAGLVQVNHQTEERTDRELQPGQLLSVRGFGRIRLKDAGSPTRKGRIPVELELFTREQ